MSELRRSCCAPLFATIWKSWTLRGREVWCRTFFTGIHHAIMCIDKKRFAGVGSWYTPEPLRSDRFLWFDQMLLMMLQLLKLHELLLSDETWTSSGPIRPWNTCSRVIPSCSLCIVVEEVHMTRWWPSCDKPCSHPGGSGWSICDACKFLKCFWTPTRGSSHADLLQPSTFIDVEDWRNIFNLCLEGRLKSTYSGIADTQSCVIQAVTTMYVVGTEGKECLRELVPITEKVKGGLYVCRWHDELSLHLEPLTTKSERMHTENWHTLRRIGHVKHELELW